MSVRVPSLLSVILLFVLTCLVPRDDARADAGVDIGQGASQQVTGPDGVCKLITNNNGSNSVFVATATVAEWQSWYNHPNGSTVAACPAACGGSSVGGHCWYLGTTFQDCNAVCSTHGEYNNATLTYAGSSGTAANCQAVLTALGHSGSVLVNGGCTGGAGCFYINLGPNGSNYLCSSPATTAAIGYSGTYRACACNN